MRIAMTYRNILIPTDGSDHSRKAIRGGVALARSLGAAVTGFHATPPATPIEYRGLLPRFIDMGQRKALLDEATRKHLGEIEKVALAAGVPCRVFSATSDYPADAILAAAKRYRCDLICMATHGRASRRGPLLGSVTTRVMGHSTLPVLLQR